MKDPRHPQHPDLFKKLSKAIEHEEDDEGTFIHLTYQLSLPLRERGIGLWIYQGDEQITRFEQFGIHALGLHHHGTPHSELDPSHRRFAQNLLRFAKLRASEGYYWIPQDHVAFFLTKLAKFHQVEFHDSGQPAVFSEHYLLPIIELTEQKSNKVGLAVHFRDSETKKEFSYGQAKVYTGRKAWAIIEQTIYPIKTSPLTSLLDDFNAEGRLDLFGNEAADFLQDYLPLLSKKPEVILPKDFSVPEILEEEAKPVFQISENTQTGDLIMDLKFQYGDHQVAPHMVDDEVLVEVQAGDKVVLIRRDMATEKIFLKSFSEDGFVRKSPTRFETGAARAFEFVSETLPGLKEKGDVLGEDGLKDFNLFGTLGEQQVKARAITSGIDWLELSLGFEVEGVEIPYEVVQALASQGQKYLKVPEKGFVKIDLDEFAKLEEKISELEGEIDESGKLRVSQFHAAYLDESFKVDWEANQEIGGMIRSLRETDQIPKRDLPEGLNAKLREYQHHGYDWLSFLHDHKFHGILADDMGLGKTVQALTYLLDRKKLQEGKPNLVLAPTSVVFNWANETKKFTPDLKVLVLTGPDRKKLYSEIDTSDLIITSYAIFRRDVEELSGREWGTVILDEAQNIKNYRSKTALLVKDLQAEQRWALTGTPLENRLSELWSIFDFLMPKFLGSYPHFKRKYQQPIEVHQSREHLDRLKRRIYPFFLRRLKDEVASELPPKTEVTNFCEMTADQKKLYQNVLAACRRQVFSEVEKKGIEKSQVSILTALLRLRQVCCHPELLGPNFEKKGVSSGKLEAFQDLVTEVMDEGHRILVFSQFVEMLALLRDWLDKTKVPYEYLDGRTRKREERINRFNDNDDIPIFLVSLRAGGTGLNLTGASYVIHYDPWWNPAVQDQATDRVHRIGQTKHVFSYKLITKDSVEEKILSLQEKKRTLAKELLSADSALGKKLSYEDLEYLFS